MTKRLTILAKNLRKNSTATELKLWKYLRAKRLNSIKFKRQQPIGRYIVDFVCFERKIIIELDGGQHAQPEHMQKDIERDNYFAKQGYRVLRFWDNELFTNTRDVLETILDKCNHPLPDPLPSRERE